VSLLSPGVSFAGRRNPAMMARQDDTGHAALVAAASRELACVVASAGAAAARACRSGPYPLAAEDSGSADRGQMGECLREVADLPAAGDVVLLGVQAQIVAQSLPGTLPGRRPTVTCGATKHSLLINVPTAAGRRDG
jgi:hypothetical protein